MHYLGGVTVDVCFSSKFVHFDVCFSSKFANCSKSPKYKCTRELVWFVLR